MKLQSRSDDCKSISSISLPSHVLHFTPRFDNEILNFHLRPDPSSFASNQLFEHVINFNSITTHPYGVSITYGDHFGLPFVKEISMNSPWYFNIWIIGISSSEPITASAAYDALKYHVQDKKEHILNVVLCKWEPTPRTRLHQLRATFDQVRSNEKVVKSLVPSGKFAIYCPTKPVTPPHFGDMLKSNFKIEWEKGLFEPYTKNAKVGVFTAPFPIEDVPQGHRVLESRVAFKVKSMTESIGRKG